MERREFVAGAAALLAMSRAAEVQSIATQRNATSAGVGDFPTLVDVDGLGGTYARRLERAPSATAADARTAAAPAAAPAATARPARPRAAAAAGTATTNAAATAGPRSAAGPASWATASGPGATAATRCVTYAYGREDEECHDQEHEQPIENTHDQAPSAGESPLFETSPSVSGQSKLDA
jgi:hypothetical protein